jgi:uncharacterized RDD family membrane protein YckC
MNPTSLAFGTLKITTPEGITFSIRLAGPLSRGMAAALDFALVLVASQILSKGLAPLEAALPDLGAAFGMILHFVVSVGYGMALEWRFQGQTVGKRVMGLRVMDARGLHLTHSQVVLRNLLRVVDLLPLVYAVGGVACLANRRGQRLGDLAAGTVVVSVAAEAVPDVHALGALRYNSFRQYPHLEARLRQKVSAAEANLAVSALLRREDLEEAAAAEVFGEMAATFRKRVRFPEEAEQGLSSEQYVRNVVDSIFRSASRSEGAGLRR